MFTARCCLPIGRTLFKIFKEGDIITFDEFLTKTDDSFNLRSGRFNATKDGYYSFSFFGLQWNQNLYANISQTLRLAVYVDAIPILKFQNYEAYEDARIGMDTISIAFNLQLNRSQEVALFIEEGQIYCGELVSTCIFNGRFVRPLIFELAEPDNKKN